jgi:hypothetical protein
MQQPPKELSFAFASRLFRLVFFYLFHIISKGAGRFDLGMHAIQKTCMVGWMCIKKKSSREMNLFGYMARCMGPLVSLGVYGWSL